MINEFLNGALSYVMPGEDPAGKLIFIVILAVAFTVCFVALVTLLAALFKELTARGRDAVETRPWMTLVYGLVGWLVFGGLATVLASKISLVAIVLPMLVCLVGAPGLYTHIGGRIGAMRNKETSNLQRVVLGATFAMLAVLFPGFGWFIVLPLLLMAEFGTGVQALLRR